MSVSDFTNAYIVAALWSSTDFDGEPLDRDHDESDIAAETLQAMRNDCAAFYDANWDSITCEDGLIGPDGSTQDEMAGHDFWLTRCGHGAGFWDGDWPEPHATKLDNASKQFGNVDLYIGDDGKIYGC